MTQRKRARKLLSSNARMATLVCVGVAETACNLQISDEPRDETTSSGSDTNTDADTGPGDTGTDTSTGGGTETDTGGDTDGGTETGGTEGGAVPFEAEQGRPGRQPVQ